ncbi:hypothetical protein QGN29_06555 [Temperatibacter marinus]|uniref:Uncharacterized protein n=1 Tax=Temperatibacter marinus TaxID=1456591 RepID=A0AA52EKR0_9PROT|nr:hypothetical protein [Temperatibacter marinus]WND04034.1 hypothetical protein QGN29_06555 [Temperatibacter marinus]
MAEQIGGSKKEQKQREAEERQKRLSENLRANLRRRKSQARVRKEDDAE